MKRTLNEGQKLFVQLMTDDIIYTNEQLAEQCGVDVRTIYRWKRSDNITKEINAIADASLGQHINRANRTLLDVMENGTEHAQLKAIDMYYKALGKYKEQSEVTINTGGESVQEKKAALMARLTGK